MNKLFQAVSLILIGMVVFIFSPAINAYIMSFVFGKQWDVALIFSFISWPAIFLGSLMLIFMGLYSLRMYFKNKKSGLENKV